MFGGGVPMLITTMKASMAAWFTPTVLFCVLNLMIAIIFMASKNNKHHHHVHGDSSSRFPRVSSLLERARSMNFSSYITTTTTAGTAESQHRNTSRSKTANYSSLSRLAQSIHFSSAYRPPPELPTREDLSRSEAEQSSLSQPIHAPSLLERVKSIDSSSFYSENTFPTESEELENSARQLVRVPSLLDRVKSSKISSPFKSVAPSTQPENADTNQHHNPVHHVIRSKTDNSGVTPAKKSSAEMKKSRSEMRIPSDDEEDVDWRRPATAREGRASVGTEDEGVDAKADDFISRFKQQLKLQRLDSLVRYNDMLNRGT